ncbi:hypothetical protein [Maricaulis sp.]|uniref:hypothetical protein n=1 Tax=Maricaulis sp. TaxID=1486257 RepID=UPI002605C3D7|nr:hypothetical protein [Maricaulis sp.]
MNPGILFLPIFRASTTAYILGLVVLAIFDFWRMKSGISMLGGWQGALLVGFFVFSLHANRRAYIESSRALGILPVVVGWIFSAIGAVIAFLPGVISAMRDFAAENGVDVEDDQAFAEAVQDPAFTDAFTAHIENDQALAEAIVANAQIGLFAGFWLTVAIFAVWFAQMKRMSGSLEGTEDTPSLYQPAEVEPANAPEPAASETVDASTPEAEPVEAEQTDAEKPEASSPEPQESDAEKAPAEPEAAEPASESEATEADEEKPAEDEPKKSD